MTKKAQDFLVDAKLGAQKFDIKEKDKEEKIVLSIEEAAVPSAVIKGKKVRASGVQKGLLARVDEKLRSMTKPNSRDKATFFRLLAIMINAGIPLIQSLDTIMSQTVNQQLKEAIYEMARLVEKGNKFSEALSNFPKIFSDAQIGMIRAGEASGQLNTLLKQIATSIEKTDSIVRKVRSAMIYPAFIILVMILVVSAMMILVVPKISELFTDSGKTLPTITVVVIAISNFMVNKWPWLLGGLLGFAIAVFFGRRTPQGKYATDWLLLHIPAFGKIVQKSIIARFARSLGNLLESGIPIIETLLINAKTVDNMLYEQRIKLAVDDVSRGIPLGESLRDTPEFPEIVVQMISVGEQTAQLDTIAEKIALYYEDEVDTAVAGISKVIEPFIIVIIGVAVGAIVAAIMLPIIQLTEITQSL
ncbi:pilus assembly protein PilC [Candidatus Peregrinibacteria bacterium CG11_big_fil_rev_8_21_14_0_20_46_8]|nr:MAG: pilus assembly protein PilC [Candidatus Peregrinibacteria bacterium CG11_big_fil_rev_8_21_14_0_20_46_8]